MFRSVKDYPNYSINKAGVIKNDKGYILTPPVNKVGTLYVNLWRKNKSKRFTLKKLIESTFPDTEIDFNRFIHKQGKYMGFSKTSFFRHIDNPRVKNYSDEEVIFVLEIKARKSL